MIKMPSNSLERAQMAQAEQTPEQKMREVAQMYEKHFLRELMKSMRSTVTDGGMINKNQAEKIFSEQLDSEYVDKWGDKGGIGLSDLIYQQLVDKYGVQLGMKKPVEKPTGPLPLTEKSFTAKRFVPTENAKANQISWNFERSMGGWKNREVTAPWSGTLLNKIALDDENSVVDIEHDNGLRSQFVYKGSPSSLIAGDRVEAGDRIGLLSPEAKNLFWHIDPTKEQQSIEQQIAE